MSKYGNVSRKAGHAQWFLQKTLEHHDRSMDHPWMQMIYGQSFTIKQYGAWLALNHAVFVALEKHANPDNVGGVYDAKLLRTAALEVDLARLLGEGWATEAKVMVSASKATTEYLQRLEEDAANPKFLLAHHFLQYNAVLSGGAYLGKMVSEFLCVPHGAPGVRFYAFEGVNENMSPARVQEYIRSFDKIEIDDECREAMLIVMRRIYTDTEVMMTECFDLNPGARASYGAAKGSDSAPTPFPASELLDLTLDELHGYTGANDGRILMCLNGELLDVSAGRELYGPGCGYAILAGHDVTRCLATMSLEPADLDDLRWEPDNAEDEKTVLSWGEKLKAKYPVAGKLRRDQISSSAGSEGLRQRSTPATTSAPAKATAAAGAHAPGEACPISGKVGTCPMAGIMGIPAAKAKAEPKPPAPAGTFMAGKSLIAAVDDAKGSTNGESFLYKICPLHWDDNTTRLLVLVAATSWISGIFIGWQLHKSLAA